MDAEGGRKLLVADDEPNVHYSFRRLLENRGVKLLEARSGEDALKIAAREHPSAALIDVRMPGMSGLEVLKRLRAEHPRMPVVIMTAYASTEVTIGSMRDGAFDSIRKPFDVPHLLEIIDRALEAGAAADPKKQPSQIPAEEDAGTLLGNSTPMQEVYKAIGQVASRDVAVLVTGESGTGKELVARAVHKHSKRATGPFVALNCAAVPDTLLDSELFGHERGAFTGATSRSIGRFERAHGGTLFLDEVGEMGLGAQAKLLRVLEVGEIERVGGGAPVSIDVRLIAATNRDLAAGAEKGEFREDLFYRLNVVNIHLPALRDRAEDVPLLANHFLEHYRRLFRRDIDGFTPGAERELAAHAWPGNVRELENSIKRAVILCRKPRLSAEEVLRTPRTESLVPQPASLARQLYRSLTPGLGGELSLLDRAEAELIRCALEDARENVSLAARNLGINRSTLRKRMAKLRVSRA